MHWAFRYLGKHAVQKLLGFTPGGFRVQELVKGAIGHQDRFTVADGIRGRARAKIERFNAAGIEPPEIVVEQGTGWLGLDLVLFHLAGTGRFFSYDAMPWLRTDLLRRHAEVLAASPDLVKRWRGTDPEGVEERARRLSANLDGPRETLLNRLGTTVRVTRSMVRDEIGAASADLFYSDSVLQFVDPGDLRVLVRSARRFLKPSGKCFHVVDGVDSHAQADARIPSLAYLAWPEPVWNLLTSRYLNYQNRWRISQFVTLFKREAFSVRVANPVVDPEDLAYVQRRFAGMARFGEMSPEEIATRRFILTGGPA